MKKLLLILLYPIIFLTSCSKSGVTPQSMEGVIVGKEWNLDNENRDGFLLAENGEFYLTTKWCANTLLGNWIIDGDWISYRYTENSQEITVQWGQVAEYSNTIVKIYQEPNVLDVYGLSNTTDHCIGETYQGGIIFYLDGNGGGLIAAPSDQSTGTEWGWEGTLISGADGASIGTGEQNTLDIILGYSQSGFPANICANLTLGGYSDWFLPSKDELNEMCLNIGQENVLGNVGGFAKGWYWSSTEYDEHRAWGQYFPFGTQTEYYKNSPNNFRAVRAF
jgi:hypothetical protein